jgi:plastocyanin
MRTRLQMGLVALGISSLAIGAAPAPISAQTQPNKVEIVLANFNFTPSDIRLVAGRPVTLQFVNQGSGGHNFTAPEFFAAAIMDAATRAKLGKKGVVELAKSEGMEVTVTPKAGSYKVKCGHFLHARNHQGQLSDQNQGSAI